MLPIVKIRAEFVLVIYLFAWEDQACPIHVQIEHRAARNDMVSEHTLAILFDLGVSLSSSHSAAAGGPVKYLGGLTA